MSYSHAPPEFDHYTIRQVLGEGGMGIVYLAHDRRTDLPVAIKVMSKKLFDPELQARFLKENQILASLNHRNIVRCYEITRARDGTPSIVMEFLDGVDFRAFEAKPYPELLPLMIQALMGMSYLKGQNVIHRDLSSSNILVTLENQKRIAKIVDFGVAKILHQQATEGDFKTQTGQFLGKFAFASPELFITTDIDWRSDVYSLGVIFHRLLTGKPPVEVARKASYFDWLMAHEQDHEFMVQAPPGLPPLPSEVVHVVRRMLARRREDRPASYEEIIEILDGAQRSLEPHLEPDEETIATLPMPAPERISSSGGRPTPAGATPSGAKSAPARLPTSVRPPAIAAVPPPPPLAPAGREAAADEAKRWPDLAETAPTQALTGKGPAAPEPPKPPAVTPPPPFSRGRDEEVARSSGTELSAPAPPAIRPPPLAPPVWAGGAVAGDTSPREAELPPSGVSDKTERIDDVVAKLRQHAASAPASVRSAPVPPPASPVPSAPPLPPVPRVEKDAKRTPPRPSAEAGPPARRLVVYGAPPAPAAPQGLPAPPVPPKGPGSRDRTLRIVGIALIVAAIVILFASVLWFIASLARGPSRGARPAGPVAPAAEIAGKSPDPPPLAAPQLTKEGS